MLLILVVHCVASLQVNRMKKRDREAVYTETILEDSRFMMCMF